MIFFTANNMQSVIMNQQGFISVQAGHIMSLAVRNQMMWYLFERLTRRFVSLLPHLGLGWFLQVMGIFSGRGRSGFCIGIPNIL
jgi:hypothetical protein